MKNNDTSQRDRTKDSEQLIGEKNHNNSPEPSGIDRKFSFYLFVMLTVYFGVTAYLVLEVGSKDFQEEIVQTILQNSEKNHIKIPQLKNYQIKMAILLLLAGVGVAAGAYCFFLKNVVMPLKKIESAIARMNDGHLEETVPVSSKDEIGRIGELINGMASNFQEVLLFTSAVSRGSKELLSNLNKEIDDATHPEVKERTDEGIQELFSQIGELDEVVHSFSFFQVKIEDGRVLDALIREEGENRSSEI